MKIGLISDTHGWIHPSIFDHFAGSDEIWHAGDIGNIQTADILASFKPFRSVFGNIDDYVVRSVFKEDLRGKSQTRICYLIIGGISILSDAIL